LGCDRGSRSVSYADYPAKRHIAGRLLWQVLLVMAGVAITIEVLTELALEYVGAQANDLLPKFCWQELALFATNRLLPWRPLGKFRKEDKL